MSEVAGTPTGPWWRALQATPQRNVAAQVRERDGAVNITVAKQKPAWLVPPLSWVIRPRLTSAVRLDAVGAHLWSLCDGQRSLEDIVGEMAGLYRLSWHESRVAVTDYVQQLVKRGVLVLIVR